METYWVLLVICSIGLIAICWHIKRCSNQIDNIINSSSLKQLFFLLLIALFVLVYIFLFSNLLIGEGSSNLLYKVYSLFSQTSGVDNVLEPIHFKIFSIVISFLGSIIFSGLLIATVSNTIQQRVAKINNGEVRYKTLKKHDIIIGANELLCQMIRYYISKNIRKRIVVLSNHNPQEVYSRLEEFDENVKKRIIIYHGNITLSKNLDALHIYDCNRIAILGDSDMSHCDAINASILHDIDKYITQKKEDINKKECFYLYWNDSFLFNSNLKICGLTVYPFNLYEMVANKLWGYSHILKKLKENEEFKHSQITRGMISPESDNYVNLIILGFNAMAIELLKTALKVSHFANYDEHTDKNATQITVISENKKEIDKFLSIYDVEKISDINLSFYSYSPYSTEERDKIEELLQPENAVSTIAVCSDDSEDNYVRSTHLPSIAYDMEVEILIQYETCSNYIIDMHSQNKKNNHINFFGFKNSTLEIRRSFDTVTFVNDCLSHIGSKNVNEITQFAIDCLKPEADRQSKEKDKKGNNLNFSERRIYLAYFDTIPSLFDSLGISLKKHVTDADILGKPVYEKIEKHFESITQRQFQALSVFINDSDSISKDYLKLSNLFYMKDEDGYKPGVLLLRFLNNKQYNKEKDIQIEAPFYIVSK